MTRSFCRALIIAIVLFGLARIADAQNTATLSGSIVDASGALLPGVQITVRQRTTGFTRSTITAADGRFVVAGISAGPYELRAELSGFRPASRADIVVTVGEVVDAAADRARTRRRSGGRDRDELGVRASTRRPPS